MPQSSSERSEVESKKLDNKSGYRTEDNDDEKHDDSGDPIKRLATSHHLAVEDLGADDASDLAPTSPSLRTSLLPSVPDRPLAPVGKDLPSSPRSLNGQLLRQRLGYIFPLESRKRYLHRFGESKLSVAKRLNNDDTKPIENGPESIVYLSKNRIISQRGQKSSV